MPCPSHHRPHTALPTPSARTAGQPLPLIARALLAACASAWILAAMAVADEGSTTPHVLPPVYPMATCPVSGQPLGAMGEPTILEYEGRELRFCCAHCEPAFHADPAKYLAKLDATVVAAQKPRYPLAACPVSGEPLGDDAVDHVHQGRLVRLCCAQCVDGFNAEPTKLMATLNAAAVEAQRKTYPTSKCVVCGETLGMHGPMTDVLIGDRLVRLCGSQCLEAVRADPAGQLQALDEAAATDPDQ